MIHFHPDGLGEIEDVLEKRGNYSHNVTARELCFVCRNWTRFLQPVPRIRMAIEQARLIRLIDHGKERIVEPHDHGILNGSVRLLGYQIAGASSRPLPNWLFMKTDEATHIELLDQTFPGGRPTSTANHRSWDKLFIRVRPDKPTRTGGG